MADNIPRANWHIRPGQDSDGPALIALIWSCWQLYPGVRMDVDAEMPELHALATHYHGALWVAEANNQIVGMIAVKALEQRTWEICRVYVVPSLHGARLGHTLLDLAERHAIDAGAERLVLWSDTRFDRAHRFYEKRSYVRAGPVRVLNDISNSLEYGYAKPVNGIAVLDIAAAGSAVGRLTTIVADCIQADGSAVFQVPLAVDEAKAAWRQAASDVGGGRCAIVAVWRDGVLVGAGLLDLAMPTAQTHRAGVRAVLVIPAWRRDRVGRQILAALQDVAAARGRSLLTAMTREGDAGELLFRRVGWQQGGRIPGFFRDASGAPQTMVLLWRTIGSEVGYCGAPG